MPRHLRGVGLSLDPGSTPRYSLTLSVPAGTVKAGSPADHGALEAGFGFSEHRNPGHSVRRSITRKGS